jgi:predicted oxidoreductase
MENDSFKEEYEIYLYSMNYIDKQVDNEKIIDRFLELGVKFFSPYDIFASYKFYYSHIEKAIVLREKIIEDENGNLIYKE